MNHMKLFTKPDISWFEKRAQKLRHEMAASLSTDTMKVETFSGGHSHFTIYSDKLPLPSGASAIEFNKSVTDAVIRQSHINLSKHHRIAPKQK